MSRTPLFPLLFCGVTFVLRSISESHSHAFVYIAIVLHRLCWDDASLSAPTSQPMITLFSTSALGLVPSSETMIKRLWCCSSNSRSYVGIYRSPLPQTFPFPIVPTTQATRTQSGTIPAHAFLPPQSEHHMKVGHLHSVPRSLFPLGPSGRAHIQKLRP